MKVFTPREHLLDTWISVASVQNNKLSDSGPQWASQKQSFKVASVLQWTHVGTTQLLGLETWVGTRWAPGVQSRSLPLIGASEKSKSRERNSGVEGNHAHVLLTCSAWRRRKKETPERQMTLTKSFGLTCCVSLQFVTKILSFMLFSWDLLFFLNMRRGANTLGLWEVCSSSGAGMSLGNSQCLGEKVSGSCYPYGSQLDTGSCIVGLASAEWLRPKVMGQWKECSVVWQR